MSRKSLKNAAVFNSRASNDWSKDESKFGQRMLEKMGWKHGQGIGLNNQGIKENIKVRLKLDNKGLGYQIKEDQWLEVRSEFSELLSQLSQGVENKDETFIKKKKSLEAISQSSKTRVHYHKYTHGKDIAMYKKEDLIGILGKKETKDESILSEKKKFSHCGNMDEYFKSKKNKSNGSKMDFSSEKTLIVDDRSNDYNTELIQGENTSNLQDSNLSSRKRKKYVKTCTNDYGSEKSVYENDINNSKDCNLTQKRKKPKELQNENETEEWRKNELVDEEVEHEQIKKAKNDILNLPRQKKNHDKNNLSSSLVKFESKLEHDNEVIENYSIDLQVENSRKKKKKPDEVLSSSSTEKNKNAREDEKQNEHDENKTCRKKEKNKSSGPYAPLEVLDDSSHKLEKRKHKSKKLSGICSNTGEHTKVFDTFDCNSKNFMTSVIDYNNSNNVENYISNFEKNRDELMNKYRERYKMKYLMSSDQIQVFGDEFDGKKLDCKKPNSEEILCVMKTVNRKNMSKAEKIIAKARLLKSIKDNTITHNFEGSNLTNILGYGSEIC